MSQIQILKATENACSVLARSASLAASFDVPVFKGIDNLDKEAPCIICYSETATEDFPFSGIHHVATHIVCKEMSKESESGSLFSGVVFEAFSKDTTKTQLNTYPAYFVYEYFITDTKDNVEGDAWVQSMTFDIISALSGSA